MAKGAGNAMGITGVFQDVGIQCTIILYTDSSAAKGISSRRGWGKVRHIELSELWLQDRVNRGKIRVWKIRGEDNFGDSLTKHASAERIAQTMAETAQRVMPGRHAIMPAVAQ